MVKKNCWKNKKTEEGLGVQNMSGNVNEVQKKLMVAPEVKNKYVH